MDFTSIVFEHTPKNLDCPAVLTATLGAAGNAYWLWGSALYDTSALKYALAITSTAANVFPILERLFTCLLNADEFAETRAVQDFDYPGWYNVF